MSSRRQNRSTFSVIAISFLILGIGFILLRNSQSQRGSPKAMLDDDLKNKSKTTADAEVAPSLATIQSQSSNQHAAEMNSKSDDLQNVNSKTVSYADPFPGSHLSKTASSASAMIKLKFGSARTAAQKRRLSLPGAEYDLLAYLQKGDFIYLDEQHFISSLQDGKSDYIYQGGHTIDSLNNAAIDAPLCTIYFNPQKISDLKYDHSESMSLDVVSVADLGDTFPGFKGLRVTVTNAHDWTSRIDCMISTKTAAGEKYKQMAVIHLLKAFGGETSFHPAN